MGKSIRSVIGAFVQLCLFILFICLIFLIGYSCGFYEGIGYSNNNVPQKKDKGAWIFLPGILPLASAEECEDGACPLSIPPEDFVGHRSMLSSIEKAHELLQGERIKKKGAAEEILFCVIENDQLKIVRAVHSERYYPLSKKRMEVVISETGGYLIERMGGGGKNTRYRIEHEGKTLPVLAVKRFEGQTAAIYTPYSNDIHTPDVVEAGYKYLSSSLVTRVFDELQEYRVPSRAFEGAFVGETQRARQEMIVIAILLNEHMGTGMFEWTDAEALIERLFVIFGANKINAYSHSKSDADARGIGQFIHDTYMRVVREYPQANLIPYFIAGTKDHFNSVKAMVCLIDTELNSLDPKIKRQFAQDPKSVEIFIPSFYNGGSGRTRTFINMLGEDWDKPINTSSDVVGESLREETIIFLRKFKEIMRYLESR